MKLYDIGFYLAYFTIYSIVIPVVAGACFFKALSKPLKILLAGLFLTLVLNLLLPLFDARTGNTFRYFISAIDVLTMSWVFYLSIGNKTTRRVILWVGFLFIPLIVVDALFISGSKSNGFSNAAEKVFVLITAIYFLTKLFQEKIESNLLKEPMFWVSAAVIANNLVGSFDVFSGPIMNYSQNLYLQYYIFWCLLTVFMYLAFACAFWLSRFNADG